MKAGTKSKGRPRADVREPGLRSRLLIGAIAGFAGTLAMTAAMSRLHRALPARERDPLTPREIIDSASLLIGAPPNDDFAMDLTTAGHFGYGAAAGSLIAAANPRIGPVTGALAGVAVWTASYLGWIPGAGFLKPATRHPRRRNALMLVAHLFWGAGTARAMRELMRARDTMLRTGVDEDAPEHGRRRRT